MVRINAKLQCGTLNLTAEKRLCFAGASRSIMRIQFCISMLLQLGGQALRFRFSFPTSGFPVRGIGSSLNHKMNLDPDRISSLGERQLIRGRPATEIKKVTILNEQREMPKAG